MEPYEKHGTTGETGKELKCVENSKKVMGFAGHLYDEQLYVIKLDL